MKNDLKGLSIASFVLGVVALSALIVFVVSSILVFGTEIGTSAQSIRETLGENRAYVILSLILAPIISFAPLIGEIFGLIALTKKAGKRGLAIAGVVINSLFVLMFLAGYFLG